MFICGSGSFGNHDEDDIENYSSPCTTPRKSKKNKNPYADRGLDKFYALLADLDSKKQKIYTEKGSEDISFVRFVYTNDSKHVKPIVVKVKERRKKPNLNKSSSDNKITTTGQATGADGDRKPDATAQSTKEELEPKKRVLIRCSSSLKLENLRQPYYYFPIIVVMILLFLAIYGRSFAVLCTSIGWYVVPNIVGGNSSSSSSSSSSERKPKRKLYERRQSEKSIVHDEGPSSPTSVINGLTDNKKTRHGHRRSW